MGENDFGHRKSFFPRSIPFSGGKYPNSITLSFCERGIIITLDLVN